MAAGQPLESMAHRQFRGSGQHLEMRPYHLLQAQLEGEPPQGYQHDLSLSPALPALMSTDLGCSLCLGLQRISGFGVAPRLN
jgi:hypothetical protein